MEPIIVKPESEQPKQESPAPTPATPTPTPAAPPSTPQTEAPAQPVQPAPATAPSDPNKTVAEMADPNLPPPPQKPADAQPAFMNATPARVEPGKKPSMLSKFKNTKIIAGIVAFLVVVSSLFFFYYLPNTPSHIWGKAMVQSGKGFDKIGEYASSRKASKGSEVAGTINISGDTTASATIKGASSGNNGDYTISLSTSGVKAEFEAISVDSGTVTPDYYIKLSGVSGLLSLLGGDPLYSSYLKGIDGNWYAIDHTTLDSFTRGADTANQQITSEDIASMIKAVSSAAKTNLFTSDTSKMSFTVKKNVGKEKIDGRNTYHFVAQVNHANFASAMEAMCNSLKDSNLKKFFNNSASDTATALDCSGLKKDVASSTNSDTADVWVDLHTKLVHKVRFSDKSNSSSYVDIGQDYQGGDAIPFTLSAHDKTGSDTTDMSLTISLNTKTNAMNFAGSLSSSGSSSTKMSMDLSITPTDTTVKVTKPAGAKNITQFLDDLGLGAMFGGGFDATTDTTTTNTIVN